MNEETQSGLSEFSSSFVCVCDNCLVFCGDVKAYQYVLNKPGHADFQ